MRIILADDQILFRTMLEEMLSKDEEIQVVATASNGVHAIELTRLHTPDLVLLDIQMPLKNGVEVLKEIKATDAATKVVMLTTFENQENIMEAYLAGSDGYLVKDIKPELLLMSLKCIAGGLTVIHPSVQDYLRAFHKTHLDQGAYGRKTFGHLSFSEYDLQIIKMIAEGRGNKDIAHALNYSEGTIKNKISGLLAQMGLSDRTQIAIFAIKNSII